MGRGPKILLVDALASGSGRRRSAVDVIGAGPRAVAGVLESRGFGYRLATAEEALSRRPGRVDVLMVSAMSTDEGAAARLAAAHPGAVRILGGPVTSDPSAVARLGYHLGVYGEGELALDALLGSGSLLDPASAPDDAPNLIRVRGGRAVLGPVRNLTREELNSFSPSTSAVRGYSRRPHWRYSRVYVEVERGCSNFRRPLLLADGSVCSSCGACLGASRPRISCPQGIPPGCGYCSIPAVYGPPRSRDPSAVAGEVSSLISLGVRRIVLSGADLLDYGRDLGGLPPTDPCDPGPNLGAVRRLLSSVASMPEVRSGRVYVGVENVKPCLLTDEAVGVLREILPDAVVHVGVETGDDAHAALLGRPCPSSEAAERVEAAARAGLRVYAYFIHGLPGQTAETAAATVSMMERFYRAGVEKVTVYRFKPLPGSAFWGLPPGPPARSSPESSAIERAARRFNLARKREMVGRRVEVLLSGDAVRGRVAAYPLREGPTVFVRGAPRGSGPGDRAEVLVTGVRSDRSVFGDYLGPA